MTRLGFKALYGSGWQLAATKNMYPDIGVYHSHQMVELVQEMWKGIEGARHTHYYDTEGKELLVGAADVRGHGGRLRRAHPDLLAGHRTDPGPRGGRPPREPGPRQPHLRPHRERRQGQAGQGAGARARPGSPSSRRSRPPPRPPAWIWSSSRAPTRSTAPCRGSRRAGCRWRSRTPGKRRSWAAT